MIVSFGIFPPSFTSSLRSRSRGSKATLLPPSNAVPPPCLRGVSVPVGVPGPGLLLLVVPAEVSSPSSRLVLAFATRRRERPLEAIVGVCKRRLYKIGEMDICRLRAGDTGRKSSWLRAPRQVGVHVTYVPGSGSESGDGGRGCHLFSSFTSGALASLSKGVDVL
jgi:hypothetical protein